MKNRNVLTGYGAVHAVKQEFESGLIEFKCGSDSYSFKATEKPITCKRCLKAIKKEMEAENVD